jgi:hypothetical protein
MKQLLTILFFATLVGFIPPSWAMIPGQSPADVKNPWRTVTIYRNRKRRRKTVNAKHGKIPFYDRVQNILNRKHIVVNVQKGKTHKNVEQ